jgi:S1-C subfamily serine protease
MKKLIILFILLLVGCTSQITEQDIESHHSICPYYDLLTQAANSIYRVHTITTVKFSEDSEEQQLEALGVAFAINEHQLLTAGHVVSIDMYYVLTSYGSIAMPILPEEKVKEEIWLLSNSNPRIPAKVIYKDLDLDFAVLEVEDGMPSPVYSIGNSDSLYVLDQVFVVTNPGFGENVKAGYITQLNFIEYTETYEIDKCDKNIFGVYLAIKSGDSGAPIMLIHDGKLEVGGLVSTAIIDGQGLGFGVKINSIMDKFKDWQNEYEY